MAACRSTASEGISLWVASWRTSTSARGSPATSASSATGAAFLPFWLGSTTPLTSRSTASP
eukprot:1052967-Prorocentrum_minimum.AAC.1